MRYRKPKQFRNKKIASTQAEPAPSTKAELLEQPSVVITQDEGRVLGFIRRDVMWSATVLVLIIAGFVAVSLTVAKKTQWADAAQKIAKSAGLIK